MSNASNSTIPTVGGYKTFTEPTVSPVPSSQSDGFVSDPSKATVKSRISARLNDWHHRTPFLRRILPNALLIIASLLLLNVIVWICILMALLFQKPPQTNILGTAGIAYSLGLRHALDADHISAIDLMTRRLVAAGQRPATVGTFFSLGHSTIVVVTSIVVAATAAKVSERFDAFGNIGGIIGTSVSAAFLIVLGIMNGFILYRLVQKLRQTISAPTDEIRQEDISYEKGGGIIFRLLRRVFGLIDRPWKMYPLGVLFGLGFDTSSEIALLGIASLHGTQGVKLWLIMIFPILFTCGMCLVDTIDGALMASLYLAPATVIVANDHTRYVQNIKTGNEGRTVTCSADNITEDLENSHENPNSASPSRLQRSSLLYLYFSTILTGFTLSVALLVGTLQLLTLILNTAISEEMLNDSSFWQGVEKVGQYYDILGGVICGGFALVGVISFLCYKPWHRWIDRRRHKAGVLGRGTNNET